MVDLKFTHIDLLEPIFCSIYSGPKYYICMEIVKIMLFKKIYKKSLSKKRPIKKRNNSTNLGLGSQLNQPLVDVS